jgi:hypothetical protein
MFSQRHFEIGARFSKHLMEAKSLDGEGVFHTTKCFPNSFPQKVVLF